jgi:hypothetical protein
MGPMAPSTMPMPMPMGGGPRSSSTPPGMMAGYGRGSRFTGGAGFRPGESFTGETGMGPGGTVVQPGANTAPVQDNAKMVELTVYGIATLYERYPPAPPAAETPKQ